ncbi:MAG TPA: histidine--tRNA ligase [Candidatus Nanoarchaeia archaeon]|nr:histidine--tRNA ligase [Candidatus Nanoarchaeia archaeon]
MELKTPKGTRDFPPEEKILRDSLISTLKEVFELYGFSPFETPAFELYDMLSSKYAGGAEILKETFRFKDQGDRDLGLRYDLTVPLARYVAMNQKMKMPFKRYHVGEVFRDGPVTTSRYRQFTQCDVDTIGASSLKADAELIALAKRVFEKLGLEASIRINNRKLLSEMTDFSGIPKDKSDDAILAIDKLEKTGKDGVEKELEEKGIAKSSIAALLSITGVKGSSAEKAGALKISIPDSIGLKEIEEVLGYCKALGVEAQFDPSLARGLSYYTGFVMEVSLSDSRVKSSVCGGGRYDSMIGDFIGKGSVCAVGISFGLDRIYDALREKAAIKKTVTRLLLVPIGNFDAASRIAEEFRSMGVPTEIDLMDRGPSKCLQYAHALGIPFVAFMGDEELARKQMKLKNMQSGEEVVCSVREAAKKTAEND